MIFGKTIHISQIEQAMKEGEFGKEIIHSRDNVAIVMSQEWCPQWQMVKSYLARLMAGGGPADTDIDVYEIVYDRLEIFNKVLRFKEDVFVNDLIPYIRYYKNGIFVKSTNYVSETFFLSQFSR